MKYLGMIADHPTPKFSEGGVLYTMEARDYKAPFVVVFDAERRHAYQPFEDVCETVQASYGTGGQCADSSI